jgi:ATP-dependent Clp protease adaptor protein ClpS
MSTTESQVENKSDARSDAHTQERTRDKPRTKQPWLWNVVLLDDDDHTYDYVITMCQEVFAHPEERAFGIAKKVDEDGRAVLLTTHKEHAELKVEQIHGFGRDGHIAGCAGAMSAIIEPAEFGGEDGERPGGDDGSSAGGGAG